MPSVPAGTCACGNGYDVLNMVIRGRLYRCHNTDTVWGSIHDAYSRYLSGILLHDPTRDRSAECQHGPVVSLCDCVCPLKGGVEHDDGRNRPAGGVDTGFSGPPPS